MKGLQLQNLTSGYGAKIILNNFSLEVAERETLVLMGASGSGKTTLLLTILGIIRAESGDIFLNGKLISNVALEERNIGYVPQDYGLFPHMNVRENVGYGLKVRGVDTAARNRKADEVLSLVELRGFEPRKISELSGGQRQRVALARALATTPDLLLLDEPLSNIDQVTKSDVATALKILFKKLEIPIILVTHNHEDALFLAEKLAIMIDGEIAQIGTVQEIMAAPKTPFIKKLLLPFSEM